MRVNIGCGQTPTAGWTSYDNSLSLRISKIPFLIEALTALGLLNKDQWEFAHFARSSNIQYADATRYIPLPSASVEFVYSSHMLEHLDKADARLFLAEVRRILKPGGMVRIAVPDIELIIRKYLANQDANVFVRTTNLSSSRPRTVLEKLRVLFVGNRSHLWMYDGRSLCSLLSECGFLQVDTVPAGTSRLPQPGTLDLHERSEETVYAEGVNP